MPSMLLGTRDMDGLGTVMLASDIWDGGLDDMGDVAWLAMLTVVGVVMVMGEWARLMSCCGEGAGTRRGERRSLPSLRPACLLRWS